MNRDDRRARDAIPNSCPTRTSSPTAPAAPAFFVDAGGPVEPLIETAERLALEPTHVLLTHHHFDHVSEVARAARALAGARGADPSAGARAAAGRRSPHPTIEAGETLTFGALEVRPLHTPGHTAGMLSLLVGERSRVAGPGMRRPRPARPRPRTHGGERRARRLHGWRGGRVHRRHPLQGLGRRRARARAHHLQGPAGTRSWARSWSCRRHGHLPGPRRCHDRRAGVGGERVHPHLEGPRPRGHATRAWRWASRRRWSCSAMTTTAAQGLGALGRRKDDIVPGSRVERTLSAGLTSKTGVPRKAREDPHLASAPHRDRRQACGGRGRQAVRDARRERDARRAGRRGGDGAGARSRPRSRSWRRSGSMKGAAMKIGQVMSLPRRRARAGGVPRGVPARAGEAARRRAHRLLQADAQVIEDELEEPIR